MKIPLITCSNNELKKWIESAFDLMEEWREEARQSKSEEEINAVLDDCLSGDFNHLLKVLASHPN